MAPKRGRKRVTKSAARTRSGKRLRSAKSATPAPAAVEHQPIELNDRAVEEALLTGEHAGLLEDYFGPAQYSELERLAREAAARRVRGGQRVLILPGIMGSKLGYPRPIIFDDVVWADPVDIALGRLRELKLNGGPSALQAVGVMQFAYLKQKFKLQIAGYDADYFAFDWRLDLIDLGKTLAAQIKAEKAPVHLVAHSMGGLVARACLLEKPKNIKRVIMLGTPNFGSFSPIMAFRGVHSIVRKLDFLDPFHSSQELAQIFGTFPGLCAMILSPEKYPANFFQLSSWPEGGTRPSQAILDRALRTHSRLPADYADPDFELHIIAGIDQETIVGATVQDDEFIYTKSRDGDGTVPLDCVRLPSAKQTYYVAEEHGSLPNNDDVSRAIDDILGTGKTDVLPSQFVRRRALVAEAVPEHALEVAPYRGKRGRALSVREIRCLLEEVAAPDKGIATMAPVELMARATPTSATGIATSPIADSVVIGRQRQHHLDITLAFGSLTEAEADAYVLGLFKIVPPGGAARVLNAMLAGAIDQMLNRRMFNANVGEITILPTGKHPVRADVVAFAGLGSFDTFNPDILEIVGENLVRTFITTRIDEIATVPIGGATGAFTADALRSLMAGFVRGLLDADRDHRFRGITICETDPERFTAMQQEFYRLCGTPLFDGIEVTLRTIRLPQPAAAVERRELVAEAAQSVFLLVRQESRSADDANNAKKEIEYSYSVLTAGAKAAIFKSRHHFAQKALDDHLHKLGTEQGLTPDDLPSFGSELAKIVLPGSILTILRQHLNRPLVVVHDAATSRIPWETLRLGETFPAIAGGLSHRYEAENLSVAKWLEERQRDAVLDVLLIVNPTEDLAGAEAEGNRIKKLLDDLGPSVAVHSLFRKDARKHEIVKRLTSGSFDVVHYAGHASFDEIDPSRSGILCAGHETLTGGELANLGNLPSLAFFNACETGKVRRGSSTTQIDTKLLTAKRVRRGSSFAEAFLRGGIANFVGTYWPVGDQAASDFAEKFYALLLSGATLGDAVMAGRKAVENIRSVDWADYILYGDPQFVLKWRAPARP